MHINKIQPQIVNITLQHIIIGTSSAIHITQILHYNTNDLQIKSGSFSTLPWFLPHSCNHVRFRLWLIFRNIGIIIKWSVMSNISSQSSYFIFSDKVHKLSIILNKLLLKRSVNSRLFHDPHFILKNCYPLFKIFILSHQSMIINNIHKLLSLFKQSSIDYVVF